MKGIIIFKDDPNLQLVDLVHDAVSAASNTTTMIETILAKGLDTYEIPRKALESFKNILSVNSMLVAKLFEENQTVNDELEKLIEKHGPQK